MKRQTVAALVIIIFGAILVGAYLGLAPMLKKKAYMDASDASSGSNVVTVRVGGDPYGGYGILRSPEMVKNGLQQGFTIDFQDDGGAYAERFAKLGRGELDIVLAPVNSLLEHAKDWPGVFIGMIAESKDADAIVGRKDKFGTGGIKALNNPTIRIAYAKGTPSQFLIDTVRTHFGLENLSGSSWRVETASSEEALKLLKSKEVDAAVLWEPDVSKALEDPEIGFIFGSGGFSGLIVDGFAVRREFLLKHGDLVDKVMQTYFTTVQLYAMDREKFVTDMMKVTGLSRTQTEAMLAKIDFLDLNENANRFFGIKTGQDAPATEGLLNVIVSCMDVMKRVGTPLASKLGTPYEITNKSVVERLVKSMPQGIAQAAAVKDFAPLDAAGWSQLKEMGTLRVEPIGFQAGVELLDGAGKLEVDAVASMLINNYPGYRVIVRGHTGHGDEEENRRLSQARADVVVQYLKVTHGLDPDRFLAEGKGSSQPPNPTPGESQRALRSRMPRVEFVLYQGNDL